MLDKPAAKIILYGSPTCPQVPMARSLLQRAGAPFEYVDISRNRTARARVQALNQGMASVPTLLFPDGVTLTEPTPEALRAALQQRGMAVRPPTLVQSFTGNPLFALAALVSLGLAAVSGEAVLTAIGVALLAFVLLKDRFD